MTAPRLSLRLPCLSLLLCAAASSGCTGPAGETPGEGGAQDGGAVDGGPGDATPVFSDAERATLATLAPATLPPPPRDPTNAHADDPAAAALGQMLFVDTGFSGALLEGDDDGSPTTLGKKCDTGKVSCAGCHVPTAAFLDDRTLGEQISLAAGWGRRRAPSLLDVGQATLLMWDGRHDALWNQPFGPVESPVEMNSSRLYVAEQIAARYRPPFEALFGAGLLTPLSDAARFPPLTGQTTGCEMPTAGGGPPSVCGASTLDPPAGAGSCPGQSHGVPGDRAEYDGMAPADQALVTQIVADAGKAIEAYERTLTCGPGRFDTWAHGGGGLSAAEQRGLAVFLGKGQCLRCHAGPYFSDEKFHDCGLQPTQVPAPNPVFLDSPDDGAAAGLAAMLADSTNVAGPFSDANDGRDPASIAPAMTGAFRTPTLRCVRERPSFMHTGQLTSLAAVVDFFDRGGDPYGYPGTKEIAPLGLTAQEKSDLVAFLQAL